MSTDGAAGTCAAACRLPRRDISKIIFVGHGLGHSLRDLGLSFPGDAASAAYYAGLDASLDHGVEGIAGEVFCAFMQSLVAAGTRTEQAIAEALQILPASCETVAAIELVQNDYRRQVELWEGRKRLLQKHDNPNFTHAPLNVALAVWALLHGADDFEKSILLSTNAGYDTDSTSATVGATLGLQLGLQKIPEKWSGPIGEGVYLGPGMRDLANPPTTLRDLTARVIAAIGRLEKKSLEEVPWATAAGSVNLNALPGTISVTPLGTAAAVPWANGELPGKSSGRAAANGSGPWIMTRNETSSAGDRRRSLLPRREMHPFLRCAPGKPYVPATHRCPGGSRVSVTPGRGLHRVRGGIGIDVGRTGSLLYLDVSRPAYLSVDPPGTARPGHPLISSERPAPV